MLPPSDRLKFLYNTTLSQTVSTCGEYLFVGNTFGDIFVFSISQIFTEPEENDISLSNKSTRTRPIQIFKSPECRAIHTLAFHKGVLIVGTVGMVTGYAYTKNEISKKLWSVKLSSCIDSIEPAEVNSLWLDYTNDLLYAGCGDNVIYSVSLGDGQIVRAFSGHTNYIHCVYGTENRLYSASEDGSVKFWDTREKRSTNQLLPYTNSNLHRPNFGKFQGTVSVTDDWLVCGGGPKASLWHLRSLECTTDYVFPNRVHTSAFVDDVVLIAGDLNSVHHYTLSGDLTAEVPISGPSAYTVVWQTMPHKFMSIGGSSNMLDICTDFNYKDIILDLYESENKKRKL